MHTDIPAIETPKQTVLRSGGCETTDIETQSYIYRLCYNLKFYVCRLHVTHRQVHIAIIEQVLIMGSD